jgi:hypothetical protein
MTLDEPAARVGQNSDAYDAPSSTRVTLDVHHRTNRLQPIATDVPVCLTPIGVVGHARVGVLCVSSGWTNDRSATTSPVALGHRFPGVAVGVPEVDAASNILEHRAEPIRADQAWVAPGRSQGRYGRPRTALR